MKRIIKLLVIAFFCLNNSHAMEKDVIQKDFPDFQKDKEALLKKCKDTQFPKRESPRPPDEFMSTEEIKPYLTSSFITIEELKIKIKELNAFLYNNPTKKDKKNLNLLNLLNDALKHKLAEENLRNVKPIEGRSLGNFARCPSPVSPRDSESIAEELKVLNSKVEREVDDSLPTVDEVNKLKLTNFDPKNLGKLALLQFASLKPLPKNGQDLKAIKIDSSDSEESGKESSREPSPEHLLNNSSDDLENT